MHNIITDEVFETLGPEGCFSETTLYDAHSLYSANKAAGDRLLRDNHHASGLPVVLTNCCSKKYGPGSTSRS